MSERYRKCPECKRVQHPYQFPWLNPKSSFYPNRPRTETPKSIKAYEIRAEKAKQIRLAAQAEGRNYSACLLCLSAAEELVCAA